MPFSRLREVIGSRRGAESWVTWAENVSVLARGVKAPCPECSSKSWRPAAQLSPPIICPLCGSVSDRLAEHENISFSYRAVPQVIEFFNLDCLPHLLAQRYLHMVARTRALGGYPGVELRDGTSADPVGEADVLLLLETGELVAGECKLRANGLTDSELRKLDHVCELLESPWSFVATLGAADSCGQEWQRRSLTSGRPLYPLVGEMLFSPYPVLYAGADLFEWPPQLQRGTEKLSWDEQSEWFSRMMEGWSSLV